jgi:hypothetical protein
MTLQAWPEHFCVFAAVPRFVIFFWKVFWRIGGLVQRTPFVLKWKRQFWRQIWCLSASFKSSRFQFYFFLTRSIYEHFNLWQQWRLSDIYHKKNFLEKSVEFSANPTSCSVFQFTKDIFLEKISS